MEQRCQCAPGKISSVDVWLNDQPDRLNVQQCTSVGSRVDQLRWDTAILFYF